jgi:hypothetical protein
MARNFENVEISVNTRFNSQLAGTSSIDWRGMGFDSKAVTEWFEPRVIGPTSAPARRGERNETWFLNVNCYAKTGETSAGAQKENVYRDKELADAVVDVFNQADLNLQDWGAGGDPVIGVIRFGEASAVPVLGPLLKSDLLQHNVSIPFTVIL